MKERVPLEEVQELLGIPESYRVEEESFKVMCILNAAVILRAPSPGKSSRRNRSAQ